MCLDQMGYLGQAIWDGASGPGAMAPQVAPTTEKMVHPDEG